MGRLERPAVGVHVGCWFDGFHKANPNHPALVQVPGTQVLGHRDLNRDGKRTGDLVSEGRGINQHGTHPGFERKTVGGHSEGCLVAMRWPDHIQFVNLYRTDARYLKDRLYRFTSTIIAGDDLQRRFPFEVI